MSVSLYSTSVSLYGTPVPLYSTSVSLYGTSVLLYGTPVPLYSTSVSLYGTHNYNCTAEARINCLVKQRSRLSMKYSYSQSVCQQHLEDVGVSDCVQSWHNDVRELCVWSHLEWGTAMHPAFPAHSLQDIYLSYANSLDSLAV